MRASSAGAVDVEVIAATTEPSSEIDPVSGEQTSEKPPVTAVVEHVIANCADSGFAVDGRY